MTLKLPSILALLWVPSMLFAQPPDPAELVKDAIVYWRGKTSYSEVQMTIHRPDWQRTLSMLGWTRGENDSLVRFAAPAKDAGNATLKLGSSMWIFTPKLNKVIKLPFSMMAQSWMGSDFSYNDLAKSDQLLHDYHHQLSGQTLKDGHTIYTVTSIPNENAPVVWGKEVVKIRDDHILIEETFYDQEMQPVKQLSVTKIAPLGGKLYPVVMRMTLLDKAEHWTELHYIKAKFDLKIPAYLFTLSNLRNPRPWSAK